MRVATRVFPSPVFISAIIPLCRIIPPISWTSKCLSCIVLIDASRTTAKASGKISSNEEPLFIFSLNSLVFCCNSESDNDFIVGSSLFIISTVLL